MNRDIGVDSFYPQPAVVDDSRGEINPASAYGIEAGLNVRQAVFMHLVCAHIASGDNVGTASAKAKTDLPSVVQDMGELSC